MEVAGLVLGALPILYGSVRVYRDTSKTINRILRKRIYVDELVDALILLEGTLKLLVKSLLQDSGCESAWSFGLDPFEYLKDQDVKQQLQEHLGPEMEAVFARTMGRIYDVIRETAKSIGGVVPELKGESTDDLHRIIKANRDQKAKQIDFVPRIKFAFKASELKGTIKEINDTVSGLHRIVNLTGRNEPSITAKVSANTNRLSRGIRRIQKVAENLHVAIGRSWKHDCHTGHAAKLFLDDRIDTVSKKGGTQFAFGLIFEARNIQGQSIWHETTVKVMEDSANTPDPAPKITPLKPCRVTILLPKIATIERKITIINDICGAIEIARGGKQQFAFVLGVDQHIGSMPSDDGVLTRYSDGNQTSLSTLLILDQYSGLKCLDLRMLLALRIASNILQLFKTNWLQRIWSKNEIYFPTSKGIDTPDLNRPFISVCFEDTKARSREDIELRAAILELGILLLEIWNWKAFQIPDTQTTPVGMLALYNQRHKHAFGWMHDTDATNTIPNFYYRAVHFCISGMDGQARCWKWDDPKLWVELCQNIIEPLHENCGNWVRNRTP
ncbi:hypothetical protein TWF106_004550 [Orbilia oligospora]|uniref:DUF7580 domain-containing protein n=1 Tax=Orbilia oligospora TaxID=2813651 RepID=A0A7C8Q683_ORBOL|nr:hypothetical protein TWF106_004550 [Orbilia oligospora]